MTDKQELEVGGFEKMCNLAEGLFDVLIQGMFLDSEKDENLDYFKQIIHPIFVELLVKELALIFEGLEDELDSYAELPRLFDISDVTPGEWRGFLFREGKTDESFVINFGKDYSFFSTTEEGALKNAEFKRKLALLKVVQQFIVYLKSCFLGKLGSFNGLFFEAMKVVVLEQINSAIGNGQSRVETRDGSDWVEIQRDGSGEGRLIPFVDRSKISKMGNVDDSWREIALSYPDFVANAMAFYQLAVDQGIVDVDSEESMFGRRGWEKDEKGCWKLSGNSQLVDCANTIMSSERNEVVEELRLLKEREEVLADLMGLCNRLRTLVQESIDTGAKDLNCAVGRLSGLTNKTIESALRAVLVEDSGKVPRLVLRRVKGSLKNLRVASEELCVLARKVRSSVDRVFCQKNDRP